MKNIFLIFLLTGTLLVRGQSKQKLDKIWSQDDSSALVTIVTYPDSIRKNILEACQKPDFLIQTEALQKSSSQSFRFLVDDYSKEEQQKFWELSRYPGLISKMSTGGKKTKEELENIASQYPADIKPVIKEYGRKHMEVLSDINALHAKTDQEFEKIIAAYPDQTKGSYRKLIKHPDVLNTLASNMHLSVMLGNMYSSDPKQTFHMLDSVKAEHTKQSAKEFEDWKSGLEKNPEAKKEMEQAAKEFIKDKKTEENTDDVYASPGASKEVSPEVYTSPPATNIIIHPYPYWFGYPWWYDHPYWYPYPYWYNLGFYWGSSGIVYMGLPSPFFMHWYFFHPYHHYNYSNFSDYAIGHHSAHYGPRYQRSGFNNEIQSWKKANEPNLPKGYLNSDGNRQKRIKELGRFETDYHNNTKGVFGRNVTRSEFLQNNLNYYPRLNPVIKQPGFNQPIKYPNQQNPIKFNMGQPRNLSTPRGGGGGAIRGGKRGR